MPQNYAKKLRHEEKNINRSKMKKLNEKGKRQSIIKVMIDSYLPKKILVIDIR